MAYVPPFFGKFGVGAKDLHSKRFDFEHSAKFVAKANTGLTIETSAAATATGALRGNVKIIQKQIQVSSASKLLGDLELSLPTDSTLPITSSFAFNKVHGIIGKVEATTKDKDNSFVAATGNANIQYSRANLSVSGNFKTDARVHKLELTAATGVNNFAVGAQVVLDATNGIDVLDANVGAEYVTAANHVYSVLTTKSFDFVSISHYAAYSKQQSVAATLTIDVNRPASPNVYVTIDQSLNAVTQVKVKAEPMKKVVELSVQHQLTNPKLQLLLSAKFNVAKYNTFGADKFGVAITAGEY